MSGAAQATGPMHYFERIRRGAASDLSGILRVFWPVLQEQINRRMNTDVNYGTGLEDGLALTALSQRAAVLESRYREAIESGFDRWMQGRLRAESNSKSMTLMDERELDLHLAGRHVSENLVHQFGQTLEMVDTRMHALGDAIGRPRESRNPLHPDMLIEAFSGIFRADDLPKGLLGMVFRLYERRLLDQLGEIYGRINTCLDEGGFRIAFKPASTATPSQSHASAGLAWSPETGFATPFGVGAGNATSAQPAPMRYRDVIRSQLRQWRSGQGAATGAPMTGAPVSTQDVLRAAATLQQADPATLLEAMASRSGSGLADALRRQVIGSLGQAGIDPRRASLAEDEQDAIDLVGILFQSLYRANELLQQAQTMYARLVAPYLKVALVDDSVFNRRSHPARQLIDAITEACDGNSGETQSDRDLLNGAEHAVDRVVREYNEDLAVFELATRELRDLLEQHRTRAQLSERRAVESVHGRERLRAARIEADGLLASRLDGTPLTDDVAGFLCERWHHYLVQTWLRDGAHSPRHLEAIRLGDHLILIDKLAGEARGDEVAEHLLDVQQTLHDCFATCGLDSDGCILALSTLVSAFAHPDLPRSVHAVPKAIDDDEHELSSEIAPLLKLVGGTDTVQADPSIVSRMQRLRAGQGLRIVDENGRESAGRIAWVSPLTARFLIVNRRGMRKMVVSAEELAVLVKSGRVTLSSVDAPFDEAMKQVWQHLNQTSRPGA